jgi:hypothetical protein
MMGSRCVAVVLASLVSVAPLYAQPKPPTEDQKAKVADLANKATAKGDKGEHIEAADLYLEAYKVYPLATMLSNAASQYQKAKKPVEALRYFCMYLEKDPAGIVASYATAQAKVLQTELGNKNIDETNPCVVKAAPVPDPGPALEPVGPATGTAAEGNSGGATLRTAGLVTGAVGLAGLGAGIYFGFRARSVSNQITNHDPQDPWPGDIKELEEKGEAHEKKQIIFLAVGGALAIGGAVMYMVGRSKAQESGQVSITPVATPDTFGVSVSGGF